MLDLYCGDFPDCFRYENRHVGLWEFVLENRMHGRFIETIEKLESILRAQNNNQTEETFLRFLVGDTCARAGRYQKAIVTLDKSEREPSLDTYFLLQTTMSYCYLGLADNLKANEICFRLGEIVMKEKTYPARWDDVLVELAVFKRTKTRPMDSPLMLEEIINFGNAKKENILLAFKKMVINVYENAGGNNGSFVDIDLSESQRKEIEKLYLEMLTHNRIEGLKPNILIDRGCFYLSNRRYGCSVRDFTSVIDLTERLSFAETSFKYLQFEALRQRSIAYEKLGKQEEAEHDDRCADSLQEKIEDNLKGLFRVIPTDGENGAGPVIDMQ